MVNTIDYVGKLYNNISAKTIGEEYIFNPSGQFTADGIEKVIASSDDTLYDRVVGQTKPRTYSYLHNNIS